MRLAQYHRDAFVSAVMNDVPKTDYDEIAHKLAQDYLVERMPPKVRAVYDDKNLRRHLRSQSTGFPNPLNNHPLYTAPDYFYIEQTPDLKALVASVAAQKSAQDAQRANLRSKLTAVVKSCPTRAALAKALPEFEKYLPAEEAKSGNLPALANVVADFVQAGWPKGKEVTV